MKPVYVVTEGQSDKEILATVLPKEVIQNVEFVVGSSRYSARSIARSILAVEQVPVALVVDADTSYAAAIKEQQGFLRAALGQASGGVRFKACLAVPEIEILLVRDRSFVEQLAGRSFSDLEMEFAKSRPKKFLCDVLNGENSCSEMLQKTLEKLRNSNQTLELLQEEQLVKELSEFVLSVSEGQN